jgi:mono/diheme cytochrome c family protein
VLLALSAGQKTGLALVGAAFIVFALASAIVIPKFRPDFPGRRVRLFAALAVVFTVGMLAAVIGFAKESEPKAAEATSATATATTAPTTTASTTTPAGGDPVAGKAVFAATGCGSCHTYGPAGSTGKVGPDLDHLAADAQKANQGSVGNYTKMSIVDPGSYVVPGFPSGVMPPGYGTELSPKQIDDLVAFLTNGS